LFYSILACFNIELRGGKGIELEPKSIVSNGNEVYLLVLKDLLDVIDAMEKLINDDELNA
jgi:hypothetical protein